MIRVYEAINSTRRERLVRTTTRGIENLRSVHERSRPYPADRWDFHHEKIEYSDLLSAGSDEEATIFILDYQRETPLPGWRFI